MSFEAYLGFSGPTATIYLSGELTDKRVPALRQLVDQAVSHPLNRLVLRMYDLTFITPSAIRCLAFAQQQLPAGADIVLDGAGEEIQRVLASGGFDRAVTLVSETVSYPEQAAA